METKEVIQASPSFHVGQTKKHSRNPTSIGTIVAGRHICRKDGMAPEQASLGSPG